MKLGSDIRVLHLLPRLESGGVERTVINEAILQKSLGILPLVISAGGSMVHELQDAEIAHLNWNMASKNPLVILVNAFRLVQLIRHQNIQIVHAHSRAPAWSACLACRIIKARLVTTFSGLYQQRNAFKRWYNSVMTRGDRIIAPSSFVREHIAKYYPHAPGRIAVIPHWIAPPPQATEDEKKCIRQELGIPADLPVIAMVARLTRWKGHSTLLRALEHLRKIDYFLLIVGAPGRAGYERELKTLVEELGLRARVLFTAGPERPHQAYAIADLVVSASTRPEAFGLN
ncbi:MAG: glycosyltransferase family 4 protein, partial [Planctomycetes bacterium]|nr:glycosyltransferase family 4 protein [Planctomycetota bacterium]